MFIFNRLKTIICRNDRQANTIASIFDCQWVLWVYMCAKHGFPVEFTWIDLCVCVEKNCIYFQFRMEKQISVIHTRSYLLVNRIQLFLFFFVFRNSRKLKKRSTDACVPHRSTKRIRRTFSWFSFFTHSYMDTHTQARYIHLQTYTEQLRYQRGYFYTRPYDLYGILFSVHHHCA